MKLYEKIKKIRREKGLSLRELHRLMRNDFKEGTITYRTIQRIEGGDTDGKGSSLHQICAALGISLSELKKDTEEENNPVDLIKKNKRLGRYVFNENAYAELLIRQNRNFMVSELVLRPNGKTKLEQDPVLHSGGNMAEQLKQSSTKDNFDISIWEEYEPLRFEKYVYCLKGTVACYVEKNKFTLRKGDGLSFESAQPHWFENLSHKESRCIIFQNPRYL